MRAHASIIFLSLLLIACDGASDHVTIGWDLSDPRTDDTGMTTHVVALQVEGPSGSEDVILGVYAGCTQQEAPADGPLLTLSCWWAGAGDDFQVRMEGTNTLTVDHRIVDEMLDIPAFSPLTTTTIPEGAEIRVRVQ